MISQGFPLWAVDEDGVTYAVIGWRDEGPVKYPVLVTLAGLALPVAAEEGEDTGLLRFTTTDPRTERPDMNKIAYEAADLRQRMTALAREWKQSVYEEIRSAALLIEKELNR